MLIPLDYDTYPVMKMSVIVYVNKDNKQCINDIFLLIRKVDGINMKTITKNHPSKRVLNRKSTRVSG